MRNPWYATRTTLFIVHHSAFIIPKKLDAPSGEHNPRPHPCLPNLRSRLGGRPAAGTLPPRWARSP